MRFSFKYSLTEDDFVAFNVFSLWEAPWQKKNRVLFTLRSTFYGLLAGVATIVIVERLFPSKKGNHFTTIILCFLGVILLAYLSYYQAPFDIKKRARKMIASDDNKHILNETELELNNEGIINVDKEQKVYLAWQTIRRYAVTKEYFYLYTNSFNAQIIPKRLFANQKSIEDFDKFITERIPVFVSFRSL